MNRASGRVLVVLGLATWSGSAFGQAPPAASFPEDKPATSAAPAPAAAPPVAPPPASPPSAAAAPNPNAAPPAPPAASAPPAAPVAPRSEVYEPPEPEPAEEREEAYQPHVSVTFSPLHLLIGPIFEAQAEVQIVPHFSAALIGGVGTIKDNDPDVNVSFSAFELGAQLVGYPLADFKHLQLGAELLWIKVSTEEYNGQSITADAGGVAIGPFIGYKLMTKVGFTFFAQGGFEYLTLKADASDNRGNSASADDSTFIPLLNLNVGWSF